MSVGIALTKAGIDSRAGNLTWALMDTLDKIHGYHGRLAAIPDATLTGLGYTTNEVATLKSAFTDLDKVWQVFYGQAAQASAYDFTTFAGQLIADMV
jgi:hypothetical protein